MDRRHARATLRRLVRARLAAEHSVPHGTASMRRVCREAVQVARRTGKVAGWRLPGDVIAACRQPARNAQLSAWWA